MFLQFIILASPKWQNTATQKVQINMIRTHKRMVNSTLRSCPHYIRINEMLQAIAEKGFNRTISAIHPEN